MKNIGNMLRNGALWLSIVLLVSLFCAVDLHAAAIASLRAVAGRVDILSNGRLPAIAGQNGSRLSSGDLIRTKTGGSAEVVYNDGTVLRIAQRSRVDIGEHFSAKRPNSSEVKLVRGRLQAIVDLKKIPSAAPGAKRFEIRTPNAIAGVRGTDYTVAYERAQTSVLVTAGDVYVYNTLMDGQIINLTPGTITTVLGRNQPSPPRPALDSDLKKMKSSAAGKSGSGGQGVTAAASLTGDGVAVPVTEVLSTQLVKTATQVVTDTVTPPPPPPPPPPAVPQTGSVTAKWQ